MEEVDVAGEAELAACLTPMLERLPEPYREAVRLTELNGVSQVDVAGRLGLSVSGMKSRVQRGRRLLRISSAAALDFDRRGGVASFRGRPDGEGCGGGENDGGAGCGGRARPGRRLTAGGPRSARVGA